jgi:hypothetical protein
VVQKGKVRAVNKPVGIDQVQGGIFRHGLSIAWRWGMGNGEWLLAGTLIRRGSHRGAEAQRHEGRRVLGRRRES